MRNNTIASVVRKELSLGNIRSLLTKVSDCARDTDCADLAAAVLDLTIMVDEQIRLHRPAVLAVLDE